MNIQSRLRQNAALEAASSAPSLNRPGDPMSHAMIAVLEHKHGVGLDVVLCWRKRVGVEPTIAIRDNDLRF